MSYKRKPKVFRVSFEDPHPLAGLTLKTHALSVREFAEFGLKLAAVAEIEQAGTDAQKLASLSGLLDSVDRVRELFAEALIEWDMEEEDGSPTPATLEGVQSLTDEEFFGIVNEWLSAIGGVGDDLGKDSSSGESIPALSDLMEPLSASPVS
jgi:hypothetical protein